ncbi:hypothetical protein BHE74_00054254, partial [Ensete ventricosum]
MYVAGNRISYVEGLHRLLKLTVLDLSFNKIITAKALGQLVANYKSLLALNLVGNPIQSNSSEEKLRKVISSFLPQLVYLNKQPMKPQRGREVATDSVAKAALGNNGWSSRRKLTRRSSQLPISSARSRIGEGSSHQGVGARLVARTTDGMVKVQCYDTEAYRVYWVSAIFLTNIFCARMRAHVARTPVWELGAEHHPKSNHPQPTEEVTAAAPTPNRFWRMMTDPRFSSPTSNPAPFVVTAEAFLGLTSQVQALA